MRRLCTVAWRGLFGFFILWECRFVSRQTNWPRLHQSNLQSSDTACCSPHGCPENDNTTRSEKLVANGTPVSELHALLLSDKLPLLDYANSLFLHRHVVNVKIESGGYVWVFEFSSGPSIMIEAVMTNKGCMGLMAGSADGGIFILPNVKRMHHYQRGRTSITGLRFWLRKGISTKRLVVVVMSRLVRLLFVISRLCYSVRVNHAEPART